MAAEGAMIELTDTQQKALDAAERITSVLCPRPGTNQEIYFNTDNFHK